MFNYYCYYYLRLFVFVFGQGCPTANLDRCPRIHTYFAKTRMSDNV